MLLDLLQKSALFLVLHTVDLDLAEKTREKRCPHCGDGILHYARYARQPRGGPDELPDELCVRHSLCCDTCRRRVLPPSVLFMGRRVYWGVVVLLVVALRQNREDSVSVRKLSQTLGVARSTIWEWMEWFRETFPTTRGWRSQRDRFGPDLDRDRPMAWLLTRLRKRLEDDFAALVQLTKLVFIPESSGSVMVP